MNIVFAAAAIEELIAALREAGYRVAGPTVRDEAIVLSEITSVDELPWGWGCGSTRGATGCAAALPELAACVTRFAREQR